MPEGPDKEEPVVGRGGTQGLKDRMLLELASMVGPLLVRMLGATWRYSRHGVEDLRRIREEGNGKVVYALWHECLLILAHAHRNEGARVLISQHRDGEIISRIVQGLGYGTVRGSTTIGGYRALLRMAAEGRRGYDLAVTPDGPKGPRHHLQAGVVVVAQRSGMPLVPVAAAAGRRVRLSSWDRFQVPHPFARVHIVYGKPMRVPADVSDERLEDLRREWETRLVETWREAEVLAGHPADVS